MKIKTYYLDFEKDICTDSFQEFITEFLNSLEGITIISSFYDDDKEQLEIQYLERV